MAVAGCKFNLVYSETSDLAADEVTERIDKDDGISSANAKQFISGLATVTSATKAIILKTNLVTSWHGLYLKNLSATENIDVWYYSEAAVYPTKSYLRLAPGEAAWLPELDVAAGAASGAALVQASSGSATEALLQYFAVAL